MRFGLMLRHLGFEKGGVGTYTREILRHMLEIDGCNEYVLLYGDASCRGLYADRPNVEEVVLPGGSKLLWDQVQAPRAARQHRVNVLFNLKHTVPLFSHCPVAFVQHGADWLVMPHQYPLADRLYFTLFRHLYWWRAAGVISVSRDTQERMAKAMRPRSSTVLRTIHHAAGPQFGPPREPSRLAALREKYGLEGPYMLYLGQIYPMKNVGRIIQAYARIRSRVPHRLLLVGRADYGSGPDLALIDQLGLQGSVIHKGWVAEEDLASFYHLADFFVFPSLYEGFGIPALEAMASGLPVLALTGGSLPEVVGEAALRVDPHDVDAIAEAMLRLAGEPALRAELSARGIARATQFSWHASARQTIELLESLAGGARQAVAA